MRERSCGECCGKKEARKEGNKGCELKLCGDFFFSPFFFSSLALSLLCSFSLSLPIGKANWVPSFAFSLFLSLTGDSVSHQGLAK